MTKEELRSYRHLLLETEQIREQLQRMESRMYSPRGQIFSSTPHSATGRGRSMEDLVAAHIRLTDKYKQRLYELESDRLRIENALDSLPSPERQVLRARYIDGLEWDDVCTRVRFSWAQTHRIHASGLRRLLEEKP